MQGYVEERRMATKIRAALALPFAFPACLLIALIVALPFPVGGRIALLAAALLEAVIGIMLLTMLSWMRIAIDDATLTIRFRILIHSRTPLPHIAACAPIQWNGWGINYRLNGRTYATVQDGNAVRLALTNGSQLLFSSSHPAAVCAALHAHRSEIVIE